MKAVPAEFVTVFDDLAFSEGEDACQEHIRLADEGYRSHYPLPKAPYPPGSDQAASWRLGMVFALPIA